MCTCAVRELDFYKGEKCKNLQTHFGFVSAMKVANFNAVAFTTLICVVALLETAIASSERSSELNPHFLYMKRLREHLADSLIALPDTVDQDTTDTTDQGQLVATSIETLTTSGECKMAKTIASYFAASYIDGDSKQYLKDLFKISSYC